MGRAGWLPEGWERRYLTSIARSCCSPTHRSVRAGRVLEDDGPRGQRPRRLQAQGQAEVDRVLG
jgi:hypothetical protein